MKPPRPTLQELPIPAGALGDMGSVEVLRAWIANQGLHVSMGQVFDDPDMWGMLLVDIARHAARALAAEKVCTEDVALTRIHAMFEAEFARPTDLGTTQPIKPQ